MISDVCLVCSGLLGMCLEGLWMSNGCREDSFYIRTQVRWRYGDQPPLSARLRLASSERTGEWEDGWGYDAWPDEVMQGIVSLGGCEWSDWILRRGDVQ